MLMTLDLTSILEEEKKGYDHLSIIDRAAKLEKKLEEGGGRGIRKREKLQNSQDKRRSSPPDNHAEPLYILKTDQLFIISTTPRL